MRFAHGWGIQVMTMDDPETRELRALCEQFRKLMQRNIERTVFDKEACQRIGDMISQSACTIWRDNGSDWLG